LRRYNEAARGAAESLANRKAAADMRVQLECMKAESGQMRESWEGERAGWGGAG